jgi:hypothetical protein
MKEYQSLSHVMGLQVPIVFIPKRCKKRIFGVRHRHLGLQITRIS